jgi:hypothetical protein
MAEPKQKFRIKMITGWTGKVDGKERHVKERLEQRKLGQAGRLRQARKKTRCRNVQHRSRGNENIGAPVAGTTIPHRPCCLDIIMAKQVQGSCNKCGHCGCYASPGGENEHWCPGIPTSILDWYLNHPDDQINKFAQYMVDRIGYTKGMRGGGRFTIRSRRRIQVARFFS